MTNRSKSLEKQIDESLDKLIEHGLIKVVMDENLEEKYVITKKGEIILETHKDEHR